MGDGDRVTVPSSSPRTVRTDHTLPHRQKDSELPDTLEGTVPSETHGTRDYRETPGVGDGNEVIADPYPD